MKSLTRFDKNNRGNTCLNCETSIKDTDNFCPNCGQVNDVNKISLKTYFSEYLAGFFSFDNRFLNTVIPLIFKPGSVSTNYINGKRMKYVNPFQLYLHVTILFFLLQGIYSTIDEYKTLDVSTKKKALNDSVAKVSPTNVFNVSSVDSLVNDSVPIAKTSKFSQKINTDTVSVEISRKQQINQYLDSIFENTTLITQLKSKSLNQKEKDSVFSIINDANYDLISNLLSATINQNNIDVEDWEQLGEIGTLSEFTLNEIQNRMDNEGVNYKVPMKFRNSLEDNFLKNIIGESRFKKLNDFMDYDENHENTDAATALFDLGYDNTIWNIFYFKKAQNINQFKDDPEFRKGYVDNIISKISVALFFLLPIFTLVVALLYIRNKNTYTEHLVFVFHTQTVFFILLMLFILVDRFIKSDIGLVIFSILFPIYLFIALRNFYQQGRFKTFVKFCLLNIAFFTIASIGFVIISFIAFLI